MVDLIRSKRGQILEVASRHGVTRVRVFRSRVISIIVRRNPRRANSRWASSFCSAVHNMTRGAPRARSQSIAGRGAE